MPLGPARRTLSACLLLAVAGPAFGDDAPADKKPTPARPSTPAATKAASPAPVAVASPVDTAQARAEVEARRKDLTKVAGKDPTPLQKALGDLWADRIRWLDEFDKLTKARQDAEHPEPSPEAEAAAAKAEIERNRAILEQLGKSPDSVLPEVFRLPAEKVDEARLSELRDTIDRIKATLNQRLEELEKLRAEPARRAAELVIFRTSRDKARAQTTTADARRKERESALVSATNPDDRQVARERLLNFRWEVAVEAQQLALAEANLSMAARRAAVVDLSIQNQEALVSVSKALAQAMGGRYSGYADRLKNRLRLQAEQEEIKAAHSEDPLEKYAASRRAELLVLEAQNTEDNKVWSATPSVSEQEQTELASKAAKDFADLKQVVQEDRMGGLVALRLNNDFRRISRERALIVRNELAQSGAANTMYENALTEAELNYLNDERDDRFERDAFVETLPKSRRSEAIEVMEGLEKRHKELLATRKDILEKLLKRAEDTHKQVTLRLRILDEQYAFIRTHIFWVRDSEPIGPGTIFVARKDLGRLIKATARLAAEPFDRSQWSTASAEFGIGMFGAVALPLVIHRVRRRLKAMIGS